MELSEQERRIMAGTRDRLLMEAMSAAELATTREEATRGCYLEMMDRLASMTVRYERCRRALWGAAFVAAVEAVVIIALAVRA